MAQALKYHLLELEGLINHRAKGLLNNCPKFLHQKYCHIFFESKSLLEKIRCVDQPLLVLYLINLFISCTRPWEGYDKDERGQPLFFDDPDECIVTSFDLIKKTIETPPQIEVFNNEQILKKAQKKFKIHKIILLKICLQQITDQMLEIFFQHNKILVFKESQQNQSCLQGLSSYDGSFTYVKFALDNDDLISTILHEYTHNLFRFIRQNSEFSMLSPKLNIQIFTTNSQANMNNVNQDNILIEMQKSKFILETLARLICSQLIHSDYRQQQLQFFIKNQDYEYSWLVGFLKL